MPMRYRGVEYTVVPAMGEPDLWTWRFSIEDEVYTGKTETRLELLAQRRAQIRINRALFAARALKQ